MNIGLFFGSFNPIHLGHTRLAQYILLHSKLDEIWLIISPNNPLKDADSLWDENLRYQLACLATQDLPGIKASDFEFALPRPNYTINTLKAFQLAYPEHQFHLIMGSDNMAIFHRWKAHDEILAHFPIIVYPRKGDNMDDLIKQYPQMQVVADAPYFPISATEIRQNMANGILQNDWLHARVKDFLQKNTILFADIKKKC